MRQILDQNVIREALILRVFQHLLRLFAFENFGATILVFIIAEKNKVLCLVFQAVFQFELCLRSCYPKGLAHSFVLPNHARVEASCEDDRGFVQDLFVNIYANDVLRKVLLKDLAHTL